MTGINRRQFLQASVVTTVAAGSLSACSGDHTISIDTSLPIGPYGADSTAEQVTEGMDLTGKTALVTGCNSGIGYECMRVLALRGAHVIGIARTLEKAETACESVSGITTPEYLDLAEFDIDGDHHGVGRERQHVDAAVGARLSALSRIVVLRVYLLHRVQGELRRIQAHGAGPLWGTQVRRSHSR